MERKVKRRDVDKCNKCDFQNWVFIHGSFRPLINGIERNLRRAVSFIRSYQIDDGMQDLRATKGKKHA
jgi:hypothetical protein